MSNSKRVTFTLLTIAAIAVVLELFLQVAARVSPKVDFVLAAEQHVIDDPKLGWRAHPGHPDHDRNGFRNRDVPDRAKLVALGDSQTYGGGVLLEEAWPHRLAALAGIDTYSMSLGGYGPTHSWVLLDEAMAFEPDVVIEAMYSGNDFYDSYQFVYKQELAPDLKSLDKRVIAAINQAEAHGPRRPKLPELLPQTQRDSPSVLRRALSEYSKLYGMARAAKRLIVQSTSNRETTALPDETLWKRLKQRAAENPGSFEIVDGADARTVLTPELRLLALDLDDPRIEEGFRVSLEAIRRMHERAKQTNKRFAVLLIPTKELVFKNVASNKSQTLARLFDNEERVWRRTKSFFDDQGIDYIDALPGLRSQLARGPQPYPMSDDGHANATGHRVMAQSVHQYLSGTPASANK